MKIENRKAAAALKRAAKDLGGYATLARKLNISKQAVYRWRRVPVDYVLKIEVLTGVSRHTLRPDIYGPKPRSEAA